MDGTTDEQNKIRRVTLLISMLLLLCSVGSYLLYQHFYQPKLTVTFVSRKVLPNTGAPKKMSRETKIVKIDKSTPESSTAEELIRNPLIQSTSQKESQVKQSNQAVPEAKIFKLSNEIEVSP